MGLEKLLTKKKTAIVQKWFDMVIETYPADSAKFYKSQKDPFANPVGRNTFNALKILFDQLLHEMDHGAIKSSLDPIIRIRAVQDFSPSQATAFIFFLKKIIRDQFDNEIKNSLNVDELLHFESKIDQLCLIAFNIYAECREKLYKIKSFEERNRTFKAFERAGLICEIPDAEPDHNKSNLI
ncbi:MAG: RsbRD N-terminal domain-containing protein [Deltaproteobacteria bacterium]|nr:RsbRD N-terminal domain-containing protein [Deltaproteobacteria bacterium]